MNFVVGWNWDETETNGANTLDACSLFDTDDNDRANYAICVVGGGDPSVQLADSPRVDSCNDTRADRCAGATLTADGNNGSVPLAQLVCTLVSPSGPDPFHGGLTDAKASCTIDFDDIAGQTDAQLLNVCTYPSQQPNSDPSDCVLIPRDAFVTIVKVAQPDVEVNFDFVLSDNVTTTADIPTSISGSGSSGPIAIVDYSSQTPVDTASRKPSRLIGNW